MPSYANQSVTLPELLDAVNGLIRAATLLGNEAVIEWHAEGRPSATAPSSNRNSIVWYRYLNADPDNNLGAGAHGHVVTSQVEINVVTRGFSDQVQKDKVIGRLHLAMVLLIQRAFYGQMLFDSYLDAVAEARPQPTYTTVTTEAQRLARQAGTEGATPRILSTATMEPFKLPAMDRPRPVQGQVETRLGVAIKHILRLSVADLQLLETP